MNLHRAKQLSTSLILAIAFAAVAAPGAAAHKVNYPSTIEILGFDRTATDDGLQDMVYGIARSEKPKCVGGRTVEIKREISGQLFTIDTAITSVKGYWAGGGDEEIGQGGTVLLQKQRIGKRKGHRHVCGGATALFD